MRLEEQDKKWWLARSNEELLSNLLAIMNSDGGHRQHEVGKAQATIEAVERYYTLIEELDKAEAVLEGPAHEV